jgi:hypothetical protein
MALFNVFEAPDGKPDRVVFIREGFSWSGFFLTFLWAVWHRMWVVAALLIAISAAFIVAVSLELLDPVLASVVQLGISVLFGFEAHRLQESSLLRAGFRHAGLIEASLLEAAELSYFAGRVASAPPAQSTGYRTLSEDTFGIFGNV